MCAVQILNEIVQLMWLDIYPIAKMTSAHVGRRVLSREFASIKIWRTYIGEGHGCKVEVQ